MKLTPEQLIQNADALKHFANGGNVQLFSKGTWIDYAYPSQEFAIWEYPFRPKPELKTRPWSKPEDVPGPICWTRIIDNPEYQSMVIGVCDEGIESVIITTDGVRVIGFESWDLIKNDEYSTDRKTWHKCEVTE